MAQKKKKDKEDVLHVLKIILAVLLLVVGVLLAAASYYMGRQVFTDEPVSDSRTTAVTYDITIEQGESTLLVGWDLSRHGVIRSGIAFFIQSKVYDCKIAPGTYSVNSKSSSKEIIKYLNQEYLRKKALEAQENDQ